MSKQPGLQAVSEFPFNAETPISALGIDPTPVELFYVRNHFDVPALDSDRYTIRINGAVTNPFNLTLDQLHQYPEQNLTMVMECAGNGRSSMSPAINGTAWNLGAISQAQFTGTPLSNILESVTFSGDIQEIKFTGSDQGIIHTGEKQAYARSLPLEIAMLPDTLLVWKMNGEPLSPHHGFPLRLLVPGWYGMASVKWLQEITALTRPYEGFFQSQEYVYMGEEGIPDHTPVTNMRVRSLIVALEAGSSHGKDSIHISGIAWSGDGKVVKVELSFNGGESWIEADLGSTSSNYEVTRWEYNWQPKGTGKFKLIARATDSSGYTQPLKSLWNKGGYGNNSVHQINIFVE
jgi:DMSO/TMAO reductase YedYZ molybdopterin-dependent catalytic subunit